VRKKGRLGTRAEAAAPELRAWLSIIEERGGDETDAPERLRRLAEAGTWD
jgi:hypothetical protein